MLDISGFLKGESRIGSKTVIDILRAHKLKEPTVVCSKSNPENLYIEEVTQYNDVFKSITKDRKTQTFVVKTKDNKRLLLCFEPRMDRIQVRTLQQKLSDITTDYVLSHIDDKAFLKTFIAFYKPMSALIAEYAKIRNLDTPNDIAFYYKGGNMFRIILGGIIRLLNNPEYGYLLKRSDADFQIFINPALPNVQQVREEVTKLVLYVLYSMREYMKRSRTLQIRGATTSLAEQYKSEISSVLQVKKVDVILREAARKDFAVAKSRLVDDDNDPNEYVLLQEMTSLMDGMEIPGRSTYFISRNTSLDFSRKDKLKATFDLIRFRRNFKLNVVDEDTGTAVDVNAPFEIIDVSIPKDHDYSMMKMHQSGVRPLLREYSYKYGRRQSISFVAPTVSYLWTDLHDLMFKQNEYPWQDVKYTKRMTRYFLTIIVYSIIETIEAKQSVKSTVSQIIHSFNQFKTMLLEKGTRGTSDTSQTLATLSTLRKELHLLQSRIANIEDPEVRSVEEKNMKVFVRDMAAIFGRMSKELSLITNDTNLETAYEKVSFGNSQTF